MTNMGWELGRSGAAKLGDGARKLGWVSLCLLALTVQARADIPPADACMTVGEACSNTGNGDPGVCKESTCSHPTPGGSMTYECYRCLPESGSGGASGAGGSSETDAGASSGGTTVAEGGALATGGSSSEAGSESGGKTANGGRATSGGTNAVGGSATSGGTNAVGGSATSTGGNHSNDSKDSGGCSVSGAPRKSGALALLFGMSLFGVAFRRQRRSR